MKGFDIKRLTPLIYVISVLILLLITFKLLVFLLPFVIATAIVSVTNPIAGYLSSILKIKNAIAKVITLTLFYMIIFLIVFIVLFNITVEVVRFGNELAQNSQSLIQAINDLSKEINSYISFLPKYTIDYVNSTIVKLVNYISNYALIILNSSISLVKKLPTLTVYTIITVLSSFVISSDKKEIVDFFEKQMPVTWIEMFFKIKENVLTMIFMYLKTQLVLITLCFFELIIGLNIINLYTNKISYVLIIAIAIALIDALPILGTGTVLGPWALISILQKEYILGVSLLVLYAIITLVRQYSEPKLLSKNAGIHPLLTLVAMYSGYRIFGVLGFLYGPIIMTIIRIVFTKEIEYGFFKYLINEKRKEINEENI
ncbi:sporulation integral membrane protein YtvI [Caviibacter abscessus]|uniref:sporulation integral membrane protein YtvI n=1 Tax=Caviibacter abscessus TaxID=1766719 RepID=UPI000833D681|nr:sporulation integral membrane protein YtvI [Caviibacter abscessus]